MLQNVHQKQLEHVLRSLFPNEQIRVNEQNEIKKPATKQSLEVDVWLPGLQLSFEFQDIYHYSTTFYFHEPLSEIQARDSIKKEQLQKRNETLVIVPYWWIGDEHSLRATIQFHRPDLSLNSVLDPIPFNPPLGDIGGVPNIGELMQASFPEYLFTTTFSDTSWWIGEKYDGVRFCWHPADRIVYSRRGLVLTVTPNVKKHFGNTFIDGEFWSGRGLFLETARLVFPEPQINLSLSRFVAFDIPSWSTRNDPYETRYVSLLSLLSSSHPILIVAGRILCEEYNEANFLLNIILQCGGEGIIFQQCHSVYIPGRSNLLYKQKTATEIDEEALVIKLTSSLIKLQLPSGDTVTVPYTPSTPFFVQNKIKKGDVVTISSSRHTQHRIPLDPRISRVRTDVTWEQVLEKFNVAKVKAKKTIDGQKLRVYFERFAERRDFDPLIAANWYQVSTKQVETDPEGRVLMAKYNTSLVPALVAAFPQIGFERTKFENTRNFWSNKQNQRKLLIDLAKKSGFDPLVARNWTSWSKSLSMQFNAIPVIARYYKNITKAVHHLFPEIGLKEKSFARHTKSVIRQRLVDFAKSKGIDPLNPESWYQFKFSQKNLTPEVHSILANNYNSVWIDCVVDTFPELNLDPSKFLHNHKRNHWHDKKNQRIFFVQFAKAQRFDPLVAENWYNLTKNQIRNTKHGDTILDQYEGSHVSALCDVFPDIGLNVTRFAEKDAARNKNVQR